MIKVRGEFTLPFEVELNVNSFEDIMFKNMREEDSDNLIKDAIYEKYNITEDIIKISKVDEVKIK